MKLSLLLSSLCLQSCLGYHVLFYHALGTKSHLLLYEPLVVELLNRGHQVTAVFWADLGIEHENYTQIVVPNLMVSLEKEATKLIMKEGGQNWYNFELWRWAVTAWSNSIEGNALQPLKDEKVAAFLASRPKVDLLVTMWQMFVGFLADELDCPLAIFSTAGPVPFLLIGTGNVPNLSLQPQLQALHIEPMSFKERFANHLQNLVSETFISWVEGRTAVHLSQELGRPVRRSSEVVRDRFSLYIGCSHPVTHGAWPYLPNVIQVGGMQLKKAGALPPDLQQFMDAAHQGVVLVSFGSSLKPSQMTEEKKKIFVETFRQLEMAVVWKWEGEVENLPSNVLVSSWLPQQDLLGHPNLRVFVTHGGLGSLVEAIYHKAVIVGIPFSQDQKPNLLRAARHGYAAVLDWDALTLDYLKEAVVSGQQDGERRAALERVHSLYMDREHRPVDTAAWWVEYACRHGGAEILGNPYLESAPWYQRHHVDLLLALLTLTILALTITLAACLACCRCCCSKKLKTE